MVQYNEFELAEGEEVAYDKEYVFVKRDDVSIISAADPLTFV